MIMANTALIEERQRHVPEVLQEFKQHPDNTVQALLDDECVVVSLLGVQKNPTVINWTRKEFIDRIMDNVAQNCLYLDLQAQARKDTTLRSKIAVFLKELEAHKKDQVNKKAAFLMSKYNSVKYAVKSKVKLIPTFEYFNKLFDNLYWRGIVNYRETTYAGADKLWYLEGEFYKEWHGNRVSVTQQMARKHGEAGSEWFNRISVSAPPKSVAFYGLNQNVMEARMYAMQQMQKDKSGALEHLPYEIMPLTEIESHFLNGYFGLGIE